MATKLPSSGSVPESSATGCDPSGLILVHRIFHWLYSELPVLIREVAPGDTARSEIIGVYAKLYFYALHLHHETEDDLLWERLTDRDPACAVHVEQMKSQHADVAARLKRIEPQLAPWVESADAKLGAALARDIDDLYQRLAAHLVEEEKRIMPVASAVMSQAEWDELEVHTRATLTAHRKEFPRDVLSLQLGLLLASVPEAERDEWFRTNVPAPVRVLYLLLMKRRYERSMAELYPDRPVPAMSTVGGPSRDE